MKKFLLLCLLALSQYVLADYQPMLVEGREWHYVDTFAVTTWEPIRLLSAKLENTIDHNGHTYWDLGGYALREDVGTQSVFIVTKDDGILSDEEMLLFKFDCQEGDAFPVYCQRYNHAAGADCIVQKVEIIDGRKHITVSLDYTRDIDCGALGLENEDECNLYLESYGTGTEKWIEGIGNPLWEGIGARLWHNPLYDVLNLPLICVRDGDNILYENVIKGYGCETTALTDVPADDLLAVSGGMLTLKGVAEGTASAVFTPDGQRVMSFTGDKADISALPSGLYILRTGTLTAKFVK